MELRRYYPFILPGTAIFALLWAVARACVQSITIDEADTYLVWVARRDPAHWQAASNNHVLNSLLMRLFTAVFGVSHLSVRAPALLGAALYIGAAYLLCRKLPSLALQWPAFVCLVYNPFVFDHLVAARGYALALGFMLCMLVVAVYSRLDSRACACCSICAALSFSANFSFAFVNAAFLLAFLACACVTTQTTRERLALLAACVLPGLLVTLFLSAPAVLHWPRGELQYGAHSLRQMFSSIAEASLFRLNPQIVNPVLYSLLEHLKPFLLPVLLILVASHCATRRPLAAGALLGILAAAIGAHWLLFKFIRIPLPMDRTAIWIVPLVTLAIASAAAGRRALTVMLYVMSFYFILCLRLTYFKEWSWDADVDKIYPVLAWYNHTYGVRDIASNWMYGSSLNFYRVQSGRESFAEIESPMQIPAGRSLYVLCYPFDEDFIKCHHLRVVYHAPDTDAVVAVRQVGQASWPVPDTNLPH
jgi:hypothetical protein